MQHFKIICTGWRCEEFFERCLDSILEQSYRNFDVVAWIDEILNIGKPGYNPYCALVHKEKYRSVKNNFDNMTLKRYGKMVNFINGIARLKPSDEDIIVDVDLDDYLEMGALYTVAAEYDRNPDLVLTYGSYRCESGKAAVFNGEYQSDRFRQVRWKASHLKTFKYKLFKKIRVGDFKGKNGKPFMTCADVAMMFPMLEMAGLDRIKHIKECLYCYNDLNPVNDHKIAKQDQERTVKYLRSLPPYKRVEF